MKKSIPVVKGKTYPVKIMSLGHSAEGVGRVEEFTVFIPGALLGETVEARIVEVKKRIGVAIAPSAREAMRGLGTRDAAKRHHPFFPTLSEARRGRVIATDYSVTSDAEA